MARRLEGKLGLPPNYHGYSDSRVRTASFHPSGFCLLSMLVQQLGQPVSLARSLGSVVQPVASA